MHAAAQVGERDTRQDRVAERVGADALGHAILPGVALAYLSGGVHGPLLLGAMIAGSATALVIGFFTRGGKLREDTAIGIVFTGALALGLAILSLHKASA